MNTGIEEYKGIRAIYPPKPGVMLKGCSSCGRDVKMDNGFVEPGKGPFKGYLCTSCTITAIGGNKASELLLSSQEKYRQNGFA